MKKLINDFKRRLQRNPAEGLLFPGGIGGSGGTGGTFGNILTTLGNLIAQATPIIVAFALLGFFWGLAIYIFNAGNEKKKAQGRNIMIWGILALFIMLSVFGIIRALQSTLNLDNSQLQSNEIPCVNTQDTPCQ